MRVLSIITPIGYGGGENQLVLLCNELQRYSIEVVVLNLTKSEEFENILKKLGIPYLTLSNFRLGFGVSQRGYLKLFIKLIPYIILQKPIESVFGKIDLLWAHGFPANASAVLMRKFGKIRRDVKLVYTHHFVKSPMRGLVRQAYQLLLDSFDRIVGVSSMTSNSLISVFPKLKEKIITIPNGIDISKFNITSSKEELRKELNLPLYDVIGVYVARFVSLKNHIFLLEVLKQMPREDFKLLLLGEGPEFESFKEKAIAEGLDKRILTPGFIPNEKVPLYLKASDVCFFPSKAEGFGVAIIEAMASGLPTVIFESVYIKEFGKNILVAKDKAEFIQLAKRLVEDKNFREMLGLKCKEDAERLSIENTARNYVKIFTELCITKP